MCAVFSGAGQMWSREKCDELAKEVVEQFDRVPVEIITTASGLMGGKWSNQVGVKLCTLETKGVKTQIYFDIQLLVERIG